MFITFGAGSQPSPPGQPPTQQCARFSIINDFFVEDFEQFTVVASPAVNFVGGSTVTVSIIDDDGKHAWTFQLNKRLKYAINMYNPGDVLLL